VSLLNNISTFILSKKESPKIVKQFFAWNQISNILIVAYDNQLSEIVDFINICKNDSISVHVAIIYNEKLDQAPQPHFNHTILDKKQFSFFKILNEDSILKLNSTLFDVLINLGNLEQIQALAISKLVAAKCKISNFQNSIFDITIDGDKTMNSSNYLKQVIVYLNMIKTK
jgi:hypothetical protein